MITEALMQLALDLAQFLLIPALALAGIQAPPDITGDLAAFVGNFASVGVWVPWTALAAASSLSVTVWAVGIGVKFLRAVAAHIPFLGGAG
jgi:hypothetical protein